MSSANETNDPSQLRIRHPTECGEERRQILQARLPEEWVVERSRTTGECYYYNKKTEKSQWVFPKIEVSQAAAGAAGAAGAATAKLNNSLSIGSNSSSNLTGGSRKRKQRKQRKHKLKTLKRRK